MPNDNELERILSDYWHENTSVKMSGTKKALNAYFLSQALEIIGAADKRYLRQYKQPDSKKILDDLKQAFQAKYAPKEGQ